MAADFIPTVMARGFHAGPVFGIFGAAVAAAKILRLQPRTSEQHDRALREPRGRQPRRRAQRRPRAARGRAPCATPCSPVALAQQGHVGGETVLEGDAGFYHAYAGNNQGQLTLQLRRRHRRRACDKITADLGKDWMFLETLYRIYSTAGYNIAHVDVDRAALRGAQHHVSRTSSASRPW